MTALGIVEDVQVFVREPDPTILGWLEDRRRHGLDARDEVWDGVLHVVPPHAFAHQDVATQLTVALTPASRARGFRIAHEVGVFDRVGSEANYRVPDVVVVRPEHVSVRGVEARAEIVIEVLSPDDGSRDKLPFYARCGVAEVWLLHPLTRALELHLLDGGRYAQQVPDADGWVHGPALDVWLRVTAEPRLELRTGDDVTVI